MDSAVHLYAKIAATKLIRIASEIYVMSIESHKQIGKTRFQVAGTMSFQ